MNSTRKQFSVPCFSSVFTDLMSFTTTMKHSLVFFLFDFPLN